MSDLREFAKIAEVRPGAILEPDGGFTCMRAGKLREPVHRDSKDGTLYVNCSCKRHYLEGQIGGPGDTHYVGFYLVHASTPPNYLRDRTRARREGRAS